MYGLIWRILPGPWVSKFIMALGLLAGAAALLWLFAFPALSPHMPFNDGAVDIGGTGTGGGGAGGGTEPGGSGEGDVSGESGEDGLPGEEGASEEGASESRS